MRVRPPHFLLFSECHPGSRAARRRWHFVLESINGSQVVEAADIEPDARADRLELLAVVRGLEALDQPSRVTLVTPSRYVSRGMRYGLDDWRENRWRWERHGRMVPIKNQDLWRRVDRALRIHEVDCRTWPLAAGQQNRENANPIHLADAHHGPLATRPVLWSVGFVAALLRRSWSCIGRVFSFPLAGRRTERAASSSFDRFLWCRTV